MIPTAWFLTAKVMAAGGDCCKFSAPGGLPACPGPQDDPAVISSVGPAAGGPWLIYLCPASWLLEGGDLVTCLWLWCLSTLVPLHGFS